MNENDWCNRRWHVEHADGRPWTTIELAKAYRSPTARFVLTEEGFLVVLYNLRDDTAEMDWDFPNINTRDMVVVFDA